MQHPLNMTSSHHNCAKGNNAKGNKMSANSTSINLARDDKTEATWRPGQMSDVGFSCTHQEFAR